MLHRSSLWGVPSSGGGHCGLCGLQAASPERNQVIFGLTLCFTTLWKTAEENDDQVLRGLYRGRSGLSL